MESYLLKGVSKKTETNGKTNGLKIEKGKGEKKVLWQQKKVQNEANWPTKQQHQQHNNNNYCDDFSFDISWTTNEKKNKWKRNKKKVKIFFIVIKSPILSKHSLIFWKKHLQEIKLKIVLFVSVVNWWGHFPVFLWRHSVEIDDVMSGEMQATIEVSVEFHNFYNVDLFQRG